MKLDLPVLFLAALAVITSRVPAQGGADWPCWGGPGQDNISPDQGLLAKWPPAGPKKLFECAGLGIGFSSPSIAGGRIYTTGVDAAAKQLQLTAYDDKGKQIWQRKLGSGWIQGGYSGARCTPTVHDGLIYVLSGKGVLTCCRAKDGKPVWKLSYKKAFASPTPKWGFAESPVVAGDLLLITPGGPKAAMVALDRKTGKVEWAVKGKGDATAYATPLVFAHGKERIAAVMTAKGGIGVDVRRGKRLWLHDWETSYDVHANRFCHQDGSLYFASGYGKGGFRLDLEKKGQKWSVKQVWTDKELDNQHHGQVLHDGRIYGSSHRTNRGAMVCLDFKTGKVLYKGPGVGRSSITFADGMLYCLEMRQGLVGLVEPGKKAFNVKGAFKLPSGGRGPYWAHPVVIGGRLYLRHADKLFVYGVKK